MLTKSGKQFVTPLSLVSLSKGKVYENLFDKENEAEIDHIALKMGRFNFSSPNNSKFNKQIKSRKSWMT